jgi:hypothetical protein
MVTSAQATAPLRAATALRLCGDGRGDGGGGGDYGVYSNIVQPCPLSGKPDTGADIAE